MKPKDDKNGKIDIIRYTEEAFMNNGTKGAKYALYYATGLMTSQKRV